MNEEFMQVSEVERNAGVRRHYQSMQVAVVIPGVQAVITGVLVAVVAGVLARLAGWYWLHTMGVTFVVVTCAFWFILQGRWYNLILQLEQALGLDLNSDGKVGQVVNVETIRVELVSEDKLHHQYLELPNMTLDQAGIVAKSLISGTFSEGSLTGGRGPFSLSQFRSIRDELLKRGWLNWKSEGAHSQGVLLTSKGGAVMREISRQADERGGVSPTNSIRPVTHR